MRKTPVLATVAVVALTSLCGLGAGSAGAARSDYGPPPAALQPISFPGGSAAVVTSGTQGPEGRTLRGTAGGTDVTLVIPAETLSIPLQVTVTVPHLEQVRPRLVRQGISGRLLAGVQVSAVKLNGTVIRGRLAARRVTVVMRAGSIRPGVEVLRWNSRLQRYVRVPGRFLTVRKGTVSIRLNRPWQLLVVAPSR
jgi:hypothetical protein